MRAHLPLLMVAPALALGGLLGGFFLLLSGYLWYEMSYGAGPPFGGDSQFPPFAMIDAMAGALVFLFLLLSVGLGLSCRGVLRRKRGARWPLAILIVLASGGGQPAWVGIALLCVALSASVAMFAGPGVRWFDPPRGATGSYGSAGTGARP